MVGQGPTLRVSAKRRQCDLFDNRMLSEKADRVARLSQRDSRGNHDGAIEFMLAHSRVSPARDPGYVSDP